jgi:hypothetical protein
MSQNEPLFSANALSIIRIIITAIVIAFLLYNTDQL